MFIVLLTAILTSVAHYQSISQRNQRMNVQVDRARGAVEQAMRQLRNLARRIDAPVINRAERSDFIFQTSDPERTWVRYCLQTQTNGTVWLWYMSTPNAMTTGTTGPCPGSGWSRKQVVAQGVINTLPGHVSPMFAYTCSAGSSASCPSTAADLGRITAVTMDLFVDDDLTKAPEAGRATSAVYLRNQNEPPTATFTARPLATRQIILNASASLDPEGRTLKFMWFRAPAPTFTCDQTPPAAALLQTGVTMTYTFLPTDGLSGTQKTMELVVCDPGGLQSRATGVVTIP
jgi:hypothetical protein